MNNEYYISDDWRNWIKIALAISGGGKYPYQISTMDIRQVDDLLAGKSKANFWFDDPEDYKQIADFIVAFTELGCIITNAYWSMSRTAPSRKFYVIEFGVPKIGVA